MSVNRPFPWPTLLGITLTILGNAVAVYVALDHRLDAIETRLTTLESTLRAKSLIKDISCRL